MTQIQNSLKNHLVIRMWNKMKQEEEERKMTLIIINCRHECTSNCRRIGCNCDCGPWHEVVDLRKPTTCLLK